MSRLRDVQRKIDRATDARARAWRDRDPVEAARLTARIEELYADLRLARARAQNGDPSNIVRRARVEREIEKLYGP